MTFTLRERWILIAAAVAVALLVLDTYALTPLMESYEEVGARRDDLTRKLQRAQSLLQRRKVIQRRWRRVVEEGMPRNAVGAESQALRAVRDWASEARLTLGSLRPERSREKTLLPEIQIHVAATGRMEAVFRLLWCIRTAKIPVKIRMLQLGSRKEGLDDLSLQLRISTLYLPEDAPGTRDIAKAPGAAGGRR